MFNLGSTRKKDKQHLSNPTLLSASGGKSTVQRTDVSSPVESVVKFAQAGGFTPGADSGDVQYKEGDVAIIEKRFEAFLSELALPPDKMAQMRSLPIDKKMAMVQQQKDKGTNVPVLHDPRSFIELLSQTMPSGELAKHLQSLEVSLRTEPIQWVKDFIAGDGLPLLLNLMKGLGAFASPTKDDREALYQTTRSLRALMNNTHGLTSFLTSADGVHTLTLLLYIWTSLEDSTRVWKNKTMALDLLSAVCFVPPDGHLKILESLQDWRDKRGEKRRFDVLVRGLRLEDIPEDGGAYLEYQIACLTFINAIVNSPEDLDFRVMLRNEFIELGIIDLLPPLRDLDHDEFNTQISIFEEEAAADIDAFGESAHLENVDMQNAEEVFKAIKGQVEGTECWNWFVRVLQGLLVGAPVDRFRGPKLWELLHITTSQIVLQRNGINPDVHKLRLNVDAAIGWLGKAESQFSPAASLPSPGMAARAGSTDIETDKTSVSAIVRMREMEERVKELEKKERILTELEEVVKRKDDELAALRKGLADGKGGVTGAEATTTTSETPSTPATGGIPGYVPPPEIPITPITGAPPPPPPPPGPGGPPPPPPPMAGGPPPPLPPPGMAGGPPPPPPPPGGGPPPPPPPPGAGGPPPPPPPPGMGGPPPPLPPGGSKAPTAPAGPTLPNKPTPIPSIKMRQLNWAKLPPTQITPNSLWKSLADKPNAEEKLRKDKLDLKELEGLFGVVGSVGAEKGKGAGKGGKEREEKEEGDVAGGKKGAITILPAKRSENIAIMLGRIKLPFDQLRAAIIEMDTNIITEGTAKSFLTAVPAAEEVELLKEFLGGNEGKLKELGKAEGFLWEMTKVPRLENRLNIMLFKSRFLERVSDIRPDIATLLKASTQLHNSKKLAQCLEIILAIGNYMNADSFRGGAWGFSIDTLTKLGDTKSTNNKTTFLHYLVRVIDARFPELKDLGAELDALEKGARVSLPAITAEVAELNRGFTDMEKELKVPASGVKNDKLHETVKAFIDSNESTLDTLKQQKEEMEKEFKAVVEYFGEDVKSATPEVFLGTFAAFVRNLERARKDNERDAEAARKAEERAAKEAEKAKLKEKPPPSLLDADRKGVVDDLISSLKTGEAFRGKTKNRQRNSVVQGEHSRIGSISGEAGGSGGVSRKPTLLIPPDALAARKASLTSASHGSPGGGEIGRKHTMGSPLPGLTSTAEERVSPRKGSVPTPLAAFPVPGAQASGAGGRKESVDDEDKSPATPDAKSPGLAGLGRKLTAGFKRA
ncbi:Diaphanous [Rhizophlyctis rosea]|nr:Diaphanous [Rhizophlyctis rosea]